ncbi:MAG: SDR family oxidoreductase [Chloroflexia bacterium]|nr:SDR family oxidoreductase [Chloroflexia bacterium]
MSGRLEGKRAFVTGASSGIGRATALRFAAEGARVGLAARRAEELATVAEEVRAGGGEALALPTDVSEESQVEAAVIACVDAWGGLDVVVGVAGIEPWGRGAAGDNPVDRLDLAVWREVVDINLPGMFLTCKHGVRALLAAGGGALIVTGSPTGLYGGALGEHAYSASKAGCHGLARVMANEHARDNVRVNVVVPGFIDTPINAPAFADPATVEEYCQGIPVRRPGRPEEVAAMMVWLASDEASYAVGGYFVVDGGQTAV